MVIIIMRKMVTLRVLLDVNCVESFAHFALHLEVESFRIFGILGRGPNRLGNIVPFLRLLSAICAEYFYKIRIIRSLGLKLLDILEECFNLQRNPNHFENSINIYYNSNKTRLIGNNLFK